MKHHKTTKELAESIRQSTGEYWKTPEGFALRLKLSFAMILQSEIYPDELLDGVENIEAIFAGDANLDFDTAGELLHRLGIQAELKVCKP